VLKHGIGNRTYVSSGLESMQTKFTVFRLVVDQTIEGTPCRLTIKTMLLRRDS